MLYRIQISIVEQEAGKQDEVFDIETCCALDKCVPFPGDVINFLILNLLPIRRSAASSKMAAMFGNGLQPATSSP
ncbi:hypothetical protein KSAC_32340 (plasmid) [Komagataeibacter saccharivorans]|nr:hypothetical protein KSAC_32340 [Komagataeibacter saccharivorans]